jgi:hypothetical protein
MTFLSASEDFLTSTLAALPGLWGKLQYLSGLRGEDGRYEHWGLERLHGKAAVQRALGTAHADVFLKILRSPLAPLLEEARLSAAEQEMEPAAYVEELCRQGPLLLPPHPGGGSEAHFSSVLRALSKLVRVRSSATRRAA